MKRGGRSIESGEPPKKRKVQEEVESFEDDESQSDISAGGELQSEEMISELTSNLYDQINSEFLPSFKRHLGLSFFYLSSHLTQDQVLPRLYEPD